MTDLKNTVSSANPPASIRVFYDGSCPICRTEIGVYQRADQVGAIDWCDVSQETQTPLPLPQQTLMARFHVQRADGAMVSGARAFLEVWRLLPGWKVLAMLRLIPGVPGIMEVGYRVFLKLRPFVQRRFER